MTDRTRDDSGRFQPEVSDADILTALGELGVAATSDVAGEVGLTRQGADRRLRQLRAEGKVQSRRIGRTLAWFVVED